MNTGEDIQGLRKITDFTRLASIAILAIHFYLSCYQAFVWMGWTASITDKIIANIATTGLFDDLWSPRLAALLLLGVSLVAVKGRKDETITARVIIINLAVGLMLYFGAEFCFYISADAYWIALGYMILTGLGYMLVMTGGGLLSRIREKPEQRHLQYR